MLSVFKRTMKKNGGTLLAITLVSAMTIGTMTGCGKADNVTVMPEEVVFGQSAGEVKVPILNKEEADNLAADSSLTAGSGRETSAVLTVMKEGMPEEMPATLYVGEGYSLYVTDGVWDNFEPNEWQVEKNNQVHFCVENHEGLNESQVESILTAQGYVAENGELWMQEDEIIYRTICYETESDVWTVTFVCPWGEAEEGWLPVMRAMADTFAVDAGYEVGVNNMAQESTNGVESEQNEYTIEGFAFADGMERSVCVTLSLESIQRGEEAYEKLQEYNSDITPPNENEEYIIATFNVSYDSGEIEELYMMENRASLEQAGLYFALSNGRSNAYDVTSYLSNSIYNISLTKDQSAQGSVAFLQEKGNTEPLIFVGFEQTVRFDINRE